MLIISVCIIIIIHNYDNANGQEKRGPSAASA